MKEIDFERAGMLLDVVAKCVNIGPMMSYIQGEAGEELKAINEDCHANAQERADERRREEADRITQQQAELAAAEDEGSEDPDLAEAITPKPAAAPILRRP